MKRSELKSIVKECLLEILMEGVANNTPERKIQESKASTREPSTPRKTYLDRMVPSQVQHEDRSRQTDNKIAQTVKSIVPNDPVMASIFADTASTTLVEQVSADSGRSLPVKETGVDPMSMFENAGNWATLAFAEKPANR